MTLFWTGLGVAGVGIALIVTYELIAAYLVQSWPTISKMVQDWENAATVNKLIVSLATALVAGGVVLLGTHFLKGF